MKERIRELAEQAGCKVMDDGEWYIPSATGVEKIVYTKGIGLEKFAELIVRECAEQIIAKGTDWVDFAPSQTGVRPEYWDMAQQIKEHFGVEE